MINKAIKILADFVLVDDLNFSYIQVQDNCNNLLGTFK
jgi:hypothetical protein